MESPVAGIFANQFGYAHPYDPVGLDTGMPEVGATLGRRPKRGREQRAPELVPTRTGDTAARMAEASAGLSASEAASRSAYNSQSSLKQLAIAEQAMGGVGGSRAASNAASGDA